MKKNKEIVAAMAAGDAEEEVENDEGTALERKADKNRRQKNATKQLFKQVRLPSSRLQLPRHVMTSFSNSFRPWSAMVLI
jgi:hypothetical protein